MTLPSLADFGWFDEGQGEPVLLLHSSGTSRRQWARLREPWSGRFRTLGLDLWGYGETTKPMEAAGFGLGQEVALARALLKRVDQPAHLVGHSYGGAVALRLALDAPELVRSVGVHEPVLFHLLRQQGCAEEWEEIARVSQDVLALVEGGQLSEAVARFVDYWNGPGAWRALSPAQQERAASSARKAPLDFAALFRETEPLSSYGVLSGKILITAGERTRRPAAKVAELLGSACGAESLEVVPGASHMAPIATPELIRPLLERLFEQA